MADLPGSEAKAWMIKAWRGQGTARRVVGGSYCKICINCLPPVQIAN